jgi:hypothetical protein
MTDGRMSKLDNRLDEGRRVRLVADLARREDETCADVVVTEDEAVDDRKRWVSGRDRR